MEVYCKICQCIYDWSKLCLAVCVEVVEIARFSGTEKYLDHLLYDSEGLIHNIIAERA